jgi:hypothetical protein
MRQEEITHEETQNVKEAEYMPSTHFSHWRNWVKWNSPGTALCQFGEGVVLSQGIIPLSFNHAFSLFFGLMGVSDSFQILE